MKEESYRKLVILAAVTILLVGLANFVAVNAGQVAQAPISTTMTTITVNSTTTSTQYSLTTSTTLSTLTLGTQTTITSSTNTVQTTSTATTLFTETPTPPTLTITTTSTESILDNAFGELLVVASVVIVIIIVAPKLIMSMRRGIVCGKCGYQNPPFARSYCANCGQALK